MTKKEIAELRRRQRRDRSCAREIYGCYVNSNKEVVSNFTRSLATMAESEAQKFFDLLRRVLGGARGDVLGKNMHLLSFKTQQVADSAEHKQLMALRGDDLADEETREAFYKKVIGSLDMESDYLILLCADIYDVPFKSKDDEEQAENSDNTFRYMLCAICPVKQTKPVLHYSPDDKQFQDGNIVNAAAFPELGFLFPAFTDRATDIYNALYYSRNKSNSHEDFVTAVFNVAVPAAPQVQKETFAEILATSLGDECSMEVTQTVHDTICDKAQLHKEAKVPEALEITQSELTDIVEGCGVSEERVKKLAEELENAFGQGRNLCPDNIVNTQKIEVTAQDVTIRVNGGRSDLIETRTINGVNYIMIRADDVKFDGIPVQFPAAKKEE